MSEKHTRIYIVEWPDSPTVKQWRDLAAEDFIFRFQQSLHPKATEPLNGHNLGQVGYVVHVTIAKPNPEKAGEWLEESAYEDAATIWAYQNYCQVQATTGDKVKVMVAARSYSGALSPAQTLEFIADDTMIPAPPGHLFVSDVQSLPKEPEQNAQSEQKPVANLTINGQKPQDTKDKKKKKK